MPCYAPNKTKWYPDEIMFLKTYYLQLTNGRLLGQINLNRGKSNQVTLSEMRHQLRRMDCLRYRQPARWTRLEEKKLRKWLPLMGDREIAKYLTAQSRSGKVFTRKTICKKRLLLDLHRTPEQLQRMVEDMKQTGIFVTVEKSWRTIRKQMKEGTRKFTRIHADKNIPYKFGE